MKKNKKINIIFPYNSVGGAFRSTYEISNRLKKLGYHVVVYFPFFPLMPFAKLSNASSAAAASFSSVPGVHSSPSRTWARVRRERER